VPRAGLAPAVVVAAAADLVDEVGLDQLSTGLLAERLGVRPPSLYKHIDSLADLQRRIAALALDQLGTAVGEAIRGRSGLAALRALALAVREFVTKHPGRYAATVGVTFDGSANGLHTPGTSVVEAIAALVRGYGLPERELDHALRTIRSALHGFATLEAGHGFQWSADRDQSFEWMIQFLDRGLRGATAAVPAAR
jgi:AcrR family transcriptional regulator